jgi:catechol 2,3-dioxygenase-like lactoylglutathione lyase family enzyme
MKRPAATGGLRHVALFVHRFEATEAFYTDLLGMAVEWRPDTDNVYLTSGNDNLALHRSSAPLPAGRLDHVGFILNEIEDVDAWYAFLEAHGVPLATQPRTHRDGARSFYCEDPGGNRVQMIFHPPLAHGAGS